MAYSTPRTWAAGERPTAAQFNQDIRDNVAALANPPACRVYHNSAQSVADTTLFTVAFNSERYDTDSMHDPATNNSRITAVRAGLHLLTFGGQFQDAADYSTAIAQLLLNGTTVIAQGPAGRSVASVAALDVGVATVYKLAVADYVQVRVLQDNTANAARNLLASGNFTPEFTATWLGLG